MPTCKRCGASRSHRQYTAALGRRVRQSSSQGRAGVVQNGNSFAAPSEADIAATVSTTTNLLVSTESHELDAAWHQHDRPVRSLSQYNIASQSTYFLKRNKRLQNEGPRTLGRSGVNDNARVARDFGRSPTGFNSKSQLQESRVLLQRHWDTVKRNTSDIESLHW